LRFGSQSEEQQQALLKYSGLCERPAPETSKPEVKQRRVLKIGHCNEKTPLLDLGGFV